LTDQLLGEFESDIQSWTLVPSDGGRFEIEINGELIFSKLQTKRHAEINEIRDLVQQALSQTT
jgi:selenoprotein W-related protein